MVFQNNEFSWDRNESEEVKIFRRMLWANPYKVYGEYGREKLREVLKIHGHKADRRNLFFWMTVLDVKEEELAVNRDPRKGFRRDCRIWDY